MPQKADLVGGLVPPAELGAGVPSALTCLSGVSTWIACGGGGGGGGTNATALQGFPIVATAPTAGQGLFYIGGSWTPSSSVGILSAPSAGTTQTVLQIPSSGGVQSSLNVNILNSGTVAPVSGSAPNITGYNWIQSPTSPSTLSAGAMTVTLPNGCPPGLLNFRVGVAQS
jgi:hypothetical protein